MKTTFLTSFVTVALIAARSSFAVVVRAQFDVPALAIPVPSQPSGMPMNYKPRSLAATPRNNLNEPLVQRDANDVTDAELLNLALTLELIECAFYEDGLSRYSEEDFKKAGYPPWVRGRFEQIYEHEITHVQFLESALTTAGVEYVKPCEYVFPHHNPQQFIDVSEGLETVGTSTYAGNIQYISNDDYTTAAASILAIEARHASWVNSAVRKQNSWNTAFETPLTVNQAYTFASTFVKDGSCPASNSPLLPSGIHVYPQLTLAPKLIPGKENQVSFSLEQTLNQNEHLYVAFLSGAATIFAPLNEREGKHVVEIPEDLKATGTVFVVIFKGGENIDEAMLNDETMVAGPAIAVFPFDSRGKHPSKRSDSKTKHHDMHDSSK